LWLWPCLVRGLILPVVIAEAAPRHGEQKQR
jgi:hypothetical protein